MRAIYLKIRITVLTLIQACFGIFGLQVRRLKKSVSVENSETELSRLAGNSVSTIVEFGAADGRDAEASAIRYPKARILAIEPVPKSFQKLAERKRRLDNLIVVEAAVADSSGTTTLFIASEADASSLSPPVRTGSAFDSHAESVGQVKVKQVTLDEICKTHSFHAIDILKMDAQGAELSAMTGAKEMLARGGIRFIYSEVQFIRLYEKACLFHELWNHLEANGFYLHGTYNFSHNEHGQLCWGDAIFVHESARPISATRAFPGQTR
jgi:FkbM family methyltransferase